MHIKVLGSGCPSCKALYESTKKAVEDNKEITVEYITDISALLEAGVMASPALLIDEKIVSVGRVPSEDEIKEYIKMAEETDKDAPAGCSCGGNC